MKHAKLLALFLVLALMVCAFAACGTKTDTPKTDDPSQGSVSEPTLADEIGDNFTMGTNAEFEPFEYRENNEIIGYDIDTANEIANHISMELNIEDMDFNSLLNALVSGKVDMVVAGMSITPERLEVVDFSEPYYRAAQVIIVPVEGATVASSADLAGKKIGVQEGTTGDIYVDENVEGAELSRFKKAVDASIDLSNGKLDAVVLDEEPAKKIVAQNPSLTILDEALTEEEYAIAVRKDNPLLLQAINETLAEIEESGKKDEFLAKYGLLVSDDEAEAESEAPAELEEVPAAQ